MITNIILEMIPPGSLPYYDTSDEHTHFVWDRDSWTEMQASRRLHLPMGIDTELIYFEALVRRALEAIGSQFESGSLLFAVHASAEYTAEDHMGHLLIAGMAFLPYSESGIALHGADPVELILGLCRGGYEHPIVAAAVERSRQLRREQTLRNERERVTYEEASKRALRLLHEFTTPEQQAELEASQSIHVRAQNGDLFRIDARSHQNIYKIVEGKPVAQYCIVIEKSGLPVYDLMLAQKLLLETNLPEFLRVANSWDLTTDDNHARAARANEPLPNPERVTDFIEAIRAAMTAARRRERIEDIPVVRPAPVPNTPAERARLRQAVEVVRLRERLMEANAEEWGIDVAEGDDEVVVHQVRAAG